MKITPTQTITLLAKQNPYLKPRYKSLCQHDGGFLSKYMKLATKCGERKVEVMHKATQKMIQLLQCSIGA
jgi:hypothetical protein